MRRIILNALLAVAMIAIGWTGGHAQRAAPDFELVVDAPNGSVKVECRRGCELVFGRSVENPRSLPLKTFSYMCTGTERCSSGIIAGWVRH